MTGEYPPPEFIFRFRFFSNLRTSKNAKKGSCSLGNPLARSSHQRRSQFHQPFSRRDLMLENIDAKISARACTLCVTSPVTYNTWLLYYKAGDFGSSLCCSKSCPPNRSPKWTVVARGQAFAILCTVRRDRIVPASATSTHYNLCKAAA